MSTTQGDIIVTAQGRDQLLSDVPVAVSAVSAETLRCRARTTSASSTSSRRRCSCRRPAREANGSARIRGIGTVGDNPGLESSVAVFIDGVYRSRSGIGLNELGEIDRIEVLRGPQGTLGGRNSSAGLISIVSQARRLRRIRAARPRRPTAITISARLAGASTCRWARRSRRASTASTSSATASTATRPTTPTSTIAIAISCAASCCSSRRATSASASSATISKRDEKCCAATYVGRSVNPYIGDLNELATLPTTSAVPSANGNNIVNVLRDLGQNVGALNAGYSRNISVSAGRSFAGKTEDKGISGQIDWNFGGRQADLDHRVSRLSQRPGVGHRL